MLDAFKKREIAHYPMVLFMVRTGCRSSEVAAVTWDDIDFDDRKASINKGYVRGRVTGTKSGKGRKIDLTPQLISELKKLKLKNQASGDTVFQNKFGGFVNMRLFTRDVFKPLCKKARLKPTRLHDLRHSYISTIDRKDPGHLLRTAAGRASFSCDNLRPLRTTFE